MILEWSTEQRVVNDLLPLEINPRKITEAKRMKMIESIQKFNLVDIPVIDTDGTIISGHQRMRALQAIGRGDELIDVRIPNRKLTTKELKEYNILANQHFGEFDMEVMDIEFKDLDFEDIGVDVKAIEFEQSDMFEKSKVKFEIEKERKAQVIEAKEDDFDTTPPAQPFTVLGDLYEIGEHRLLCGDSTDSDQVAKLMNGEKADMVFTDPPYGINIVNSNSKKVGGGGETKFGKVGGNKIVDAKVYSQIIGDDTTDTARDFYNTCIAMGFENFIIWGGNYFTDFLNPSMCWIVWDKENTGDFADVELAWTSFDKGAKLYKWLWNGMSRKGSRDVEGITRVHPTQKPVGLFINIFNDFMFKMCYDGFLGSGSTMVAAHQAQRRCYGMELGPNYCDVIVKRMHKLDPSLRIIRNGIDITDTIDSL